MLHPLKVMISIFPSVKNARVSVGMGGDLGLFIRAQYSFFRSCSCAVLVLMLQVLNNAQSI